MNTFLQVILMVSFIANGYTQSSDIISPSATMDIFLSSNVIESPFLSSVIPTTTSIDDSPLISSSINDPITSTIQTITTTFTSATNIVSSPIETMLSITSSSTLIPQRDIPSSINTITTLQHTSTVATRSITISTAGASSTRSLVTPTSGVNDDDLSFFLTQLKFIYIIAGVILFLVLVIIILLVTVGFLCTRKSQRGKRKRKIPPRALPSSQAISPAIVVTSPKRKTENAGSPRHKKQSQQESMSDFPLLCRVLEQYDSLQAVQQQTQLRPNNSNDLESSITSSNSYHIRVPSGASSDLDTSVRTAMSYISQDSNDYDELESIASVLNNNNNNKSETGSSPPKSPPKTLPKPTRLARKEPLKSVEEENPSELIDAHGYHTINIITRKDDMKRSQSAHDIFDDPKYPKLIVPSPDFLTKSCNESNRNCHHSLKMKRSLTVSDMESSPFDKRDYKDYMSLQQVLDLVNTKMSPDRDLSAERENNEELYCPRLLRPVAMDTAS